MNHIPFILPVRLAGFAVCIACAVICHRVSRRMSRRPFPGRKRLRSLTVISFLWLAGVCAGLAIGIL